MYYKLKMYKGIFIRHSWITNYYYLKKHVSQLVGNEPH